MRAAVLALCLIAPPAGAEAFFDIGISHSQIESKNTDVSVPIDRTETSLHLGIGASRSVGERGELSVRLELERPITERLSVAGYWRFTENDSNTPVFDYGRHILGGALTLNFGS